MWVPSLLSVEGEEVIVIIVNIVMVVADADAEADGYAPSVMRESERLIEGDPSERREGGREGGG